MAASLLFTLALPACVSGPTIKPSSATVGSPMSSYCASSNTCPGLSKKKFEVCGSCDPATRYFRQAMCSLDEKVRKAIDSCVQGKAKFQIKGMNIFEGTVVGCVTQRLENEPQMVEAFTAIAKKHKATEAEQAAWREQCDRLWAQHTGATYVRTVNDPAPPIAKPVEVKTYNKALLAKATMANTPSGGGKIAKSPKGAGYAELVNNGNALKKAGQFDDAVKKYIVALADQQRACEKSKRPATISELGKDAPCRRASRVLFNIAITRRDASQHQKAAMAFGSYLRQWSAWYPDAKAYPLEERARFEMAQALFKLDNHRGALTQYRIALGRWQAHHPKQRARFADDALHNMGVCLEKLGRNKDAAAVYKAFLAAYKKAHGKDHADADAILAKIKSLQ
ncbi:MAG: tetratricopeptide repeat protein [Myxococcales bacterium]|nr:tetratricopeptide repeat protein [Myxococcales bacterium]